MECHKHLPLSKRFSLFVCVLYALPLLFCTGCAKNDSGGALGLKLIADSLISPVDIVEPPDNSKRLFIVDLFGQIWVINNGQKLSQPFIDLSTKMIPKNLIGEAGLLDIAFAPDYSSSGKFYIFYVTSPRPGGPAPGLSWHSLVRISEFKVSASDPNHADLGSERVLLEVDHPQGNHFGGTLTFGPDGYLYISLGDGGGADDDFPGHVADWYSTNAGGNAQNIYANLLGKILRIDVNGSPYSIPSDNPFVGTAALPEIYAFGLRNPYRIAFDLRGTHELYAMDAGQSLYEEINHIQKGGNYGWNVKEGTICFNTDNDLVPRSTCPTTDTNGNILIDPVLQLKNDDNPGGGIATTIIGGRVYRGTTIPSLNGKYIFGIYSQNDLANAKMYVATISNNTPWTYEELKLKGHPNDLGLFLQCIGQDLSGELFLATQTSGGVGKVYKLVAQ